MDLDNQSKELERVINENRLNPVFQAIVDSSCNKVYGYEALIRGPADSPLHSPLALFKEAYRFNKMEETEASCRSVSADAFVNLSLPGKLFLNISPICLVQEYVSDSPILSEVINAGISPRKVIIEISEQYPVDDFEEFLLAIDHFRKMGFKIAIDDLGSGYAGLKTWARLKPDYVKVDRHFIERIDSDPVKQEFVRSIKEIGDNLGCKIVAEGIESEAELEFISSLGINLLQGYLLGRPEAKPVRGVFKNTGLLIRKFKGVRRLRHTNTVSDLIVGSPTLPMEMSLEETVDLFMHSPSLMSLPVCDQERPLGMISRHRVLEIISGRYSRELYGKRSIAQFMTSNCIIVDEYCSLSYISDLLTEQPSADLNQDFIITRNGEYLGVGSSRTLLKKITDLQLNSARYANPLTQLPGNVPIYEHIDRLLELKQKFWVAYLDLNHFKPYNDVYGYSHGDEVLQFLGHLVISQTGRDQDFAGHIGGDDFVVIITDEKWEEICNSILNLFEENVERFYKQKDIKNRGIWSEDRAGNSQFFDMLTLAIGVVHPDPKLCLSHHDVASIASDAKHQAKKQQGNSLFYCRRRGPTATETFQEALEEAEIA